jgi:hypothetical protein
MSYRITLSIPQPLAARIEERRGDESVQDYALAAIRVAMYGSSAGRRYAPRSRGCMPPYAH